MRTSATWPTLFTFPLICVALAGCEEVVEQRVNHVFTCELVRGPGIAAAAADVETAARVINARLRNAGRAVATESGQIEVEVPENIGDPELERIKRLISSMGVLEFRITADPSRGDIHSIIQQAMAVPATETAVMVNATKVAEWVTYSADEFGPADVSDPRIVKRIAGATPQALVLIDSWNVTGDYLTSATKGVDGNNGPAVRFSLNTRGAGYFGQLTGENLPNRAVNSFRYLGIILDHRLISAPSVNSKITDSGMISGGGLNDAEVTHIVGILTAGRLPASIRIIDERVVAMTMSRPMSIRSFSGFGSLAVLAAILIVGLIVVFSIRRK